MSQSLTRPGASGSIWSRRAAGANASAETADADAQPAPVAAPAWHAAGRGIALFFGCLALLTVYGELRAPGPNADFGWIDARPLTPAAGRGLLALCGSLLAVWSLRPALPPGMRRAALVSTATLLAVALWNTFVFYRLMRSGALRSGCPVPIGLHVATCLTLVLAAMRLDGVAMARPVRDGLLAALTLMVCVIAFPIAQMFCLGRIDHRESADAIVVFTSGTTPADAQGELAERARTACRLYHDGLAGLLVVPGGPMPSDSSAAGRLQALAVKMEVPAERIVDAVAVGGPATEDGLVASHIEGMMHEFATDTAVGLRRRGTRKVLVVGADEQLPRMRLCFRRAGVEALTVPCGRRTAVSPDRIGQEIAATWRCLLGLEK